MRTDSGSRSARARRFIPSLTLLFILASSGLLSPFTDARSSVEYTWVELTIDEVTNPYQHATLAVDSQGGVHFVYWLGYTQRTLAYAHRTPGGDLSITEVGYYNSSDIGCPSAFVAVDSDANAHIAYSSNQYLYYSSNSEGEWDTVNLSAEFSVYGGADIAVDSVGGVWIATTSIVSNGDLAVLRLTSGTWTSEVVSGCRPGERGACAIALSSQDDVHICYIGYGGSDEYGLWHVTGSSTSWAAARVDSQYSDDEFIGRPSVAADSSGGAFILVDANLVSGWLDVFFYSHIEGQTSWVPTLMSTHGISLQGRSLAIGADGGVHMIYNNMEGGCTYAVYHPETGAWGWKDSPDAKVSCIALDAGGWMHVVKDQYPLFPSYRIVYVSNAFRVPDVPQAVQVEVDGVNVTLSWSPPPSNGGLTIDSYSLKAAEEGSDQVLRADVPGNTTRFTFTNLTPETDYMFTVVAINQLGESAPSLPVNTTTGPESVTDDGSWVIFGLAAASIVLVVALIVVWYLRGGRQTGKR